MVDRWPEEYKEMSTQELARLANKVLEETQGGQVWFTRNFMREVVDRLLYISERKMADFTEENIKDMHNELCLKCGNYKNAHLGACNGCRWKKEEN